MTRSTLRDRDLADEIRSALRRDPDTFTDRFRDTVERASDTAAETRARAEELGETARHRAEAARERAAEVGETVRQRAEQAKERAEEARPVVERILASLAEFLSQLAERGRSAASKVPPPASEQRRRRLRTAGWFAGGFAAGLAAGWFAHARFEERSHGAMEPFYEEQIGFDGPPQSPYGSEAEAIDASRRNI